MAVAHLPYRCAADYGFLCVTCFYADPCRADRCGRHGSDDRGVPVLRLWTVGARHHARLGARWVINIVMIGVHLRIMGGHHHHGSVSEVVAPASGAAAMAVATGIAILEVALAVAVLLYRTRRYPAQLVVVASGKLDRPGGRYGPQLDGRRSADQEAVEGRSPSAWESSVRARSSSRASASSSFER